MENKNYMEQVAKILGVELNEKFDIEGCSCNPCRLTEYGLLDYLDNSTSAVLEMLLTGRAKLIKKPWIPTVGELFCYIHTDSQGDYFIAHSYWRNDTQDKGLYALGNFFKTEEEALDNLKSYKEFVESLTPNMSWRNS